MPGITTDQAVDLLNSTLPDLPREDDVAVALSQRSYPACNVALRKFRRKTDGGESLRSDIQYRDSGAARATRLYDTDRVNQVDTTTKATGQWVMYTTNWTTDRVEVGRNMGRAKLYSLVKRKRIAGMLSAADLFESHFFDPGTTDNDPDHYAGLFYHIRKAAVGVNTEGAFNGISVTYPDGTVSNTWQGINRNADAFSRLRNWTGQYSGAINDTLILRLRLAYEAIGWNPPLMVSELMNKDAPASAWRIYAGINEKVGYEHMAAKRGETLGTDVAPFGGMTAFKRIPIVSAQALDNDVTKPFVMTNHNEVYFKTEAKNFGIEHAPAKAEHQHNVIVTHVDWSMQLWSEQPKYCGAVIHVPRTV